MTKKARKHRLTDSQQLLLDVIQNPGILISKSPKEWDLVLRLVRRTRLLGRLANQFSDANLLRQAPIPAANALIAAKTYAEQRQQQIRWELNRVAWALSEVDIKPVLLKGSAYLVMNLPISAGRLFADVDLLVREEQLTTAENTLSAKGWHAFKLNRYDQRYYREWMHELPPMRHQEREIEVDLHHNILPRTSRLKPRSQLLFDDVVAHPSGCFQILSPVDLVIHSATHMFYDGEITNSIRDLIDLDDLMRCFGKERNFWDKLVPRARKLDLLRPVYYALRYARTYLDTPIPESVLADSASGKPRRPVLSLMDRLVPLAMLPQHPDFQPSKAATASWLLYIRSHWLKMPPWLLASHLIRKGWRKTIQREKW